MSSIENLIYTIARSKAGSAISLRNAWETSLERLSVSGISAVQFAHLAKNMPTPTLAGRLADTIRPEQDPEAICSEFLESVDRSNFELGEWMSSLDILFAWLAREGRTTTMKVATGFISCSEEAVGSTDRFANLSATVSEMLDNFGFEGDSEAECN